MAKFWREIWQVEGHYQPDHPVLGEWYGKMRTQTRATPEDEPLSRDEAWDRAVAKMAGWRAPGPDGIEGFWWKTFKGPAKILKWRALDEETEIPDWVIMGRTIMIPKDECTGEPHQFR